MKLKIFKLVCKIGLHSYSEWSRILRRSTYGWQYYPESEIYVRECLRCQKETSKEVQLTAEV